MLVVSLRGWKSQNLVSSRDFRTQRQYALRLLIMVAHGLCYKVISISKDPATLTHSRGVLLITAYTGRLHPKGVHDLFSPIGCSPAGDEISNPGINFTMIVSLHCFFITWIFISVVSWNVCARNLILGACITYLFKLHVHLVRLITS